MMDIKKRYTVQLFGEEFHLLTDESDEHLVQAGHMVNTYIQEIREKSPDVSEKKIALLVALRLASKLITAERAMTDQARLAHALVEHIQSALPTSHS